MSSLIDAIPWEALITWSSLAVGLTAALITVVVYVQYSGPALGLAALAQMGASVYDGTSGGVLRDPCGWETVTSLG